MFRQENQIEEVTTREEFIEKEIEKNSHREKREFEKRVKSEKEKKLESKYSDGSKNRSKSKKNTYREFED